MPDIDYQELLVLIASIIKIALPFGVITGFVEWAVTFFLKCVFPRRFKGD